MNPIDQMRKEHRVIEEMLQVLNEFCCRLESGATVNLEDGVAMIDFFQVYADKFHHDKEERLIFPLLERLGVPKAGGPLEIMLEDHEQGRAQVREMSEMLGRLQAGDREPIPLLAVCARNYQHLMLEHIKTEDDAIFDMAEMRLSTAQLDQLAAEFVTVGQIHMGAGKDAAWQALLNRLKDLYLPDK